MPHACRDRNALGAKSFPPAMDASAELARKHCHERKGEMPLPPDEAERLARAVPAWKLEGETLVRELRFPGFSDAVAFIARIARLAQAESHHPDLHLTRYRNLRIEFTTHSVGGLSENDFIMAAHVDRLPGLPTANPPPWPPPGPTAAA